MQPVFSRIYLTAHFPWCRHTPMTMIRNRCGGGVQPTCNRDQTGRLHPPLTLIPKTSRARVHGFIRDPSIQRQSDTIVTNCVPASSSVFSFHVSLFNFFFSFFWYTRHWVKKRDWRRITIPIRAPISKTCRHLNTTNLAKQFRVANFIYNNNESWDDAIVKGGGTSVDGWGSCWTGVKPSVATPREGLRVFFSFKCT